MVGALCFVSSRLRVGSSKGLSMTDEADAKAWELAPGLIQGYIGPDYRVIDMKVFFATVVPALREARRTSK